MKESHRARPSRRIRAMVLLLGAALPGLHTVSGATAAPLPSISINDVSVGEGTGGTVSVTFTVSQDTRGKTTIRYATANGTAVNPADYVSESGQLRFAGNNKKKKVTVTVMGDSLDEANETFFVRLSAPVNATIGDGEGEATITDDDAPPSVSAIGPLTVPEGSGGTATFASIDVALSTQSGKQVTVEFGTVDGTATGGSDFDVLTAALVFPPGQTTRSAVVEVNGDDDTEGDETFDLDISNPTNATLGTHPATVTIQDNDPIPPGSAVLSVSGGSIREGNSGVKLLVFTVTRSGETATPVDVDFETTNGKALAPFDYSSASGNLAFAALETTKTVSVSIVGERRLERREDFFLSLLNPSVGAAVNVGQATGFINNDDSKTTLSIVKRPARITAKGRVSPAHPNKRMRVALLRWRNGKWVRLALKRPRLSGSTDLNGDGITDSRYSTVFNRPNPGRCRIKSTFPGDPSHGPSSVTKNFRC